MTPQQIMKLKHTPAPWSIKIINECRLDAEYFVMHKRTIVAHVRPRHNLTVESMKLAMNDSRLIAEAPKMYELLKEIRDMINHGWDVLSDKHETQIFNLIKKIDGEEHEEENKN